jgi:hypothetical protein
VALATISDDRLRLVWRNITYYVVDAILDCAESLCPTFELRRASSGEEYHRLALELTARLQARPRLRQDTRRAFAIVVEVLDGDEARVLAARFRASIDYRQMMSGREALERSKRTLQLALAALMADALSSRFPAFASLVRSCGWSAFRRDLRRVPS